jgi:hypothetical protein
VRIGPGPVALIALVAATATRAARAEDDPAHAEAKRLYAEAHDHFVAGRCPEAMPLLLRANQLVPSPNPGLLIARCLAAAGRRAEAATRYRDVEHDALERVRSGETRYAETAAAAAKEGAALRAQLGTVRIRLLPRSGVGLEVDGAPTEIGAAGETVLLHEPGEARVAFVLPAARRERVVAVAVGRESVVAYEADVPAPPPARGGLPWTFHASGALAVAGGAAFVGFGLASESTYGDLEAACGGRCGPERQEEADRGRAYQTLANVGLAAGLLGLVLATVVLLGR